MDTPMTDDPGAPTAPSDTPDDGRATGAPPHAPRSDGEIGDWLAALRRSTQDRMVGGVAGGLALRLGLPSWVVRAGFVIAACLGVGIPLYVLAWALVPDDRGGRLFGNSVVGNALLVAALVVGSLVLIDIIDDSGYASLVRRALPWIVVLTGLVLLLRRSDTASPTTAPPPPAPPFASFGPTGPADPTDPVASPLAPTPTPAASGPAPATTPSPLPPPVRPAVTRPRRPPVVGLLTWCVALVAVAVTGLLGLALGSSSTAAGPGVLLAVVMIVLGAGLTFSAVRGRARGLILPALAVGSLLLGLTALDVRADTFAGPFERRVRDEDRLPATLTAAVGGSRLDVGELRLTDDRSIEIRQTLGDVQIVLPRHTTTVVRLHVGAGGATVDRPSGQSVLFDGSLRDRWLGAGLPRDGALLTADDLFGAARGRFTLISDDIGREGRRTFDRSSPHRLTVDVEVGAGSVHLVDPRWTDIPDQLLPPVQLCTVGGGPRGVVEPCPEVPDGARVALCINDLGNLVDCREDRPGTIDDPRIAACRDTAGFPTPCDGVGIVPAGAELVSPADPSVDDPTPDPEVDPMFGTSPDPTVTAPTTSPDDTIAPPSGPGTVPAPGVVPTAPAAPTTTVAGG